MVNVLDLLVPCPRLPPMRTLIVRVQRACGSRGRKGSIYSPDDQKVATRNKESASLDGRRLHFILSSGWSRHPDHLRRMKSPGDDACSTVPPTQPLRSAFPECDAPVAVHGSAAVRRLRQSTRPSDHSYPRGWRRTAGGAGQHHHHWPRRVSLRHEPKFSESTAICPPLAR
jgi:hypothetical protein